MRLPWRRRRERVGPLTLQGRQPEAVVTRSSPTVRLPRVAVPRFDGLGDPPDGALTDDDWVAGEEPGPFTPPPVPREFDLVRRRMGTGLVPGERVLVAQHRHPVVLLEPVLLPFAVLLGFGTVTPYLGSLDLLRNLIVLGWFALTVRAGWRFAEWGRDWFVVTDRRLLRLHGILDTKRDMMPLQKVTDMAFERPVWGRIIGYGTFILESAGREQALREIRYVREPERTYEAICVQIFTRPVSYRGPGEGTDGQGYRPERPRRDPRDDEPAASSREARESRQTRAPRTGPDAGYDRRGAGAAARRTSRRDTPAEDADGYR
ncbi:PH domain-containing protein [Aquipuribacter sp. SD81]|uniref:PH domain-containing protein n=1 Tax=Aquipuribacter sp. SD81 TaxID=3127703 RepID=UPI003019EC12